MSQRITPADIDPRKASDLFRSLREMVAHYVPEWPAKDDDDPGVALLKIFSFIGEGVISRLNRAPERNFLAFLDLLGIRLLQARPAQVPVRFLVANGTEVPLLVDSRTQVSAPPTGERPEDLPFETLTPLLVIPSTLTSLIAVDPELDAIYKPPPGFLKLESAATPLPELRVMAFSGVGAKNLQLDPPEQVKKDDFLRVDQKVIQRSGSDQCVPIVDEKESSQSEHLVVAEDPKGAVVTLMDPLRRDYVEGTAVRKVTQFELFEAKNWQEHILYLAHSEYFSIKSEAEITIRVQHAGTSSNLQRLNVVWEFFGSVEALKDELDTWHEFQLESDGTQGLSRNGQIRLTKPEGEIKETEIDGRKSRWIRARLDQSLPANSTTPVPKIELIDFAVSSAGNALSPDNAFHNDTPLTTDVAFFPFGTEPRIFDRFSIASEEAFSKPGSEIELDFSLDTTELLSSPSGFHDGKRLRVFSRAVAGKLLEFQITPQTVDIDRHGNPLDKPPVSGTPPPGVVTLKAASTPAVVTDNAGRIAVFVPADDGKIYVRYLHPAAPVEREWKSLRKTPGSLQFDPAVIHAGGFWLVFAVADNKLYGFPLDPAAVGTAPEDTDLPGDWFPIENSPQIDSSPFISGDPTSIALFVTDVDGIVHMLANNGVWTALRPGILAKKNARPFARRNAGAFRVFVRDTSDQLLVFDTDNPTTTRKVGKPPSNVGSNPHGSPDLTDPIYVRGAKDSHLWSTTDVVQWDDHGTSNDIELNGDPFVIENPAGSVSVLSTSKRNVLLEFRIDQTVVKTGTIEAGPRSIVFLEKVPAPAGTYYIHILDGPGAEPGKDVVRKIKDATHQFVVLDQPLLKESPTPDTKYDLLRQEGSGTVVAVVAADTLTLSSIAGIDVDDFIFVENAVGTFQLRKIDAAPANKNVHVSVDLDISETLTNYVILRIDEETHEDHPTRLSELRAVLSGDAQAADDFYNNKFLRITDGPGKSSVGRRISDYFHDTNNVVLDSGFPEHPTNASTFAITPSGEAWHVHEDKSQPDVRPELSWEYWNGRGWLALQIEDTTRNLLIDGTVKFILPDNVQKTEVAGQENFWIRARIVGGDYGREQFTFNQKTGEIKVEKDPIRPPRILNLDISYDVTEHKEPQFCVTFNSLTYLDQTAANTTQNKNFFPFVPLSDEGKALYLGFDRAFRGGPVKIYFAAKELEVDERNKPKLAWQFAFENNWKELLPEDGTEGFTRPDFVTLNVTDDIQNRQQFGKTLYWLRTTLTEGEWNGSPLFSGVFLNTVEAMQARTVLDEILGSSIGVKNQKFQFQQTPVIKGEEVRVLEALTDEEREQLLLAKGEDTVRTITDQAGRVLATWIRWTEVPEFFDSDSNSRHYRLDRHTGEIEFGDGIHGRIPPAGGDNIVAFRYQAGGGAAGNVKPGEINSLITAVAGVDSVINPVAAGGGSNAATNEEMLTIGPAQISHRDRAVTPDDFERLALEASREVRKVQCLPNRNASGRHESGWTTVHIVPDSEERQPVPSLGLRRAVQRYLAERADVTLVDQKHIVIGPPKYVPVTVVATVYAKSLDLVAKAEQNVKKGLETFLHPLKGGPEKQGWEFGRDLAASDLYALLEGIDEVDYVGSLQLFLGNSPSGEQVEVEADALIASGTHRITTTVAPENK
ncbi:MAG TPA: putative baseplate assembly protein [Pyrinomonadaceae bacterium]|nr:putative baseplate assembly protein [Pyrinomonadaceae bacterium]